MTSHQWKRMLKVTRYSSPEHVISQLQSVTCHMGSDSMTSEHTPP